MRGRAAALLLLSLLMAGCAASVTPASDDAPPAPVARVGHLSPEMTLTLEAWPERRAVGTGSFFEAWAEGRDYPTWLDDPPGEATLVENVTMTLFVRATGPVAETTRFPDVMVYAGSGDAWMGYGSADTPPLLVPDQVYELAVDVEVPAGGLFLPADAPLGIKVVPVMTQDAHRDVEILVGGASASRVAWTERPVTLPDVTLAAGEDAGELAGSAYAGAAAPESIRHETPLPFTGAPSYVFAWMNTTTHDGIPDLDLALVGPDGDTVASAGTPTPREALRLAAPNLGGPGEYRLVVTSYGSARATFTIEWLAG